MWYFLANLHHFTGPRAGVLRSGRDFSSCCWAFESQSHSRSLLLRSLSFPLAPCGVAPRDQPFPTGFALDSRFGADRWRSVAVVASRVQLEREELVTERVIAS